MNRFFALARPFLEAGALTHAEVEAVALVAPRFHEANVEALLGLAFVAAAPRLGHVVVALPDAPRLWAAAARTGHARSARETDRESLSEDEDSAALPWPSDLAAWHATTLASSLVGARKPFVAVPHSSGVPRLATHRRDAEEHAVATLMLARAARPQTPPAAIDELLHGLFGTEAHGEAANAVRLASANSLAIVTGGPGTGKTFSITRLLAALALSETETDPLVVRLAAPTGKAAARMGEAIAEGLRSVALPNPLRERLGSLKAETIHRLVGLRPNGTVRHNAANPLRASLVVVDEASMVDLSLMRTLLNALPDHARLVLLGDPDQLASVEAGAVLGDLVRSPLLAPCRMHFTTSRRFGTAPTLAACAHALQTRDDAGDAPPLRLVPLDLFLRELRGVGGQPGGVLVADLLHRSVHDLFGEHLTHDDGREARESLIVPSCCRCSFELLFAAVAALASASRLRAGGLEPVQGRLEAREEVFREGFAAVVVVFSSALARGGGELLSERRERGLFAVAAFRAPSSASSEISQLGHQGGEHRGAVVGLIRGCCCSCCCC